jgi:hypothetical protein
MIAMSYNTESAIEFGFAARCSKLLSSSREKTSKHRDMIQDAGDEGTDGGRVWRDTGMSCTQKSTTRTGINVGNVFLA